MDPEVAQLIAGQTTHLVGLVVWLVVAVLVALLWCTRRGRTWLEDESAWIEAGVSRLRDGRRHRDAVGEALVARLDDHIKATPIVVRVPSFADARTRAKQSRLVLVHSRSGRP